MMWKKRLLIGLGMLILLFASSDSTLAKDVCQGVRPHVCQAARQLIKQKQDAVNRHHLHLYLTTIDAGNRMYQQEQKRWFQDAVQVIDPGSFRLHVRSVRADGIQKLYVDLEQIYSVRGQKIKYQIPLTLRYTNEGWKDADLSFARLGNDQIVVYYTDPSLKPKARIAFQTLNRAVLILQKKFGWKPQKVEVKLYHSSRLFHQSVKPSLPWWAGGWHEAGQSIKFVANGIEPDLLASGLIHELTHQMVSDLTNDNAAYWLQEGAAMYYEANLMPELRAVHNTNNLKEEWTLSELESKRLEKLPAQEAHKYYLHSYVWYEKLVKKYGDQGMKKLFAHLKKFSYINQDSDQKRVELNHRTRDALSEVFQIPPR